MKTLLFFGTIFLTLLTACNKVEVDQIDILVSIAQTDTEYGFISNISEGAVNLVGQNVTSIREQLASEVSMNSLASDTVLVKTLMFGGVNEVNRLDLVLFETMISKESKVIFDTEEEKTIVTEDLTIQLPADGGYKGAILFELDMEKSLSMDDEGNYIFEPFFIVTEQ